MADDGPAFADDIQVKFKIRRRRPGLGDEETGRHAGRRNGHYRTGHDQQAAFHTHHHAAKNGAQQDGEEGPGLDQRIAGDEFAFLQMVGQDTVFQRPEEGGLGSHQKQHNHQQPDIAQQKTGPGQSHNRDFHDFDEHDEARFFQLVGQLPGDCGKQEIGQDEHAGGRGDQHARVVAADLDQPVGDQNDQRLPIGVVVERPQELGNEQWQEPPRFQQVELALLQRVIPLLHFPDWRRALYTNPIKASSTASGCSAISIWPHCGTIIVSAS